MSRSRDATVNETASRYLRSAYPVVAGLAICYALLLGLLNIAQAMGSRLGAFSLGVEHYTHVATWQGSSALPALLGAFMLFLAYQLWLRKRAALVVLCSFIIVQAMVDVVRGMSHTVGAVTVFIGIALLLALSEFPARPDPRSFRRFKVALPLFAAAFFTYGVAGIYLMRGNMGIKSHGVYALAYRSVTVTIGDSGIAFHGWAMAFRVSLTAAAVIGFVVLAAMLFRSYRAAPADADQWGLARELVTRYGSDSLSYFNLRRDKSLFFLDDRAFIAYRAVGDVAVMSGDPVGPADLVVETMTRFKEFCQERGWRVAGMASNGDLVPLYEEAGMKAFPFGEEAVVDLQGFSLEGRAVRKLRQSVSKLEKAGMSMEFMFNSSIPNHVRHELAGISAEWRGGKEETGFSMGLGRLLASEDPDCLLSVAYDAELNPAGFLYFVPMYPHLGYSLDIHRFRPGTPGALNEYMIAKTALFLRENGYRYLSLHFLALSQHYREDSPVKGSRFWAWTAQQLDRAFPVVSSYRFDKKFLPRYTSRLVLHESALDLLLVAAAVICAESAHRITRPAERRKAARKTP